MKLDIDTSKWFSDKTRLAIIVIGILTLFNTIALIILLGRGSCGEGKMPEMLMGDRGFEQMMDGDRPTFQMREMHMGGRR